MAVIKNDEIFVGGASSPIKVGIKLNGKEDVGTEVVANPELTGEEEELTGLEIDKTKYKIAEKKLYSHLISLAYQVPSSSYVVYNDTTQLVVISSRAEAYDIQSLGEYLYAHGVSTSYKKDTPNVVYPASGLYGDAGSTIHNVLGIIILMTKGVVTGFKRVYETFTFSSTSGQFTQSYAIDTGSLNYLISDKVMEL